MEVVAVKRGSHLVTINRQRREKGWLCVCSGVGGRFAEQLGLVMDTCSHERGPLQLSWGGVGDS